MESIYHRDTRDRNTTVISSRVFQIIRDFEKSDEDGKVETDKAWERSWTRRIFISVVTYIIAAFWLYLIHESIFWLKAIVPVAGYVLSTISIPQLKKIWVSWKNN